METNWNQLIERYLQNELSEEGRAAFEQELNGNTGLREELETHQLIRSAAKRASQRTMIQQAGKSYYKSLRIKQFTIGVVLTAVTVTGIVYWVQSRKQAVKNEPKQELTVITSSESSEESPTVTDQVKHQPEPAGDKSLLIQSSGEREKEPETVGSSGKSLSTSSVIKRKALANEAVEAKLPPAILKVDSIPASSLSENKVLAYTDEDLKGEPVSVPKNMEWVLKYDSVGKFNDIYCGYALVMHEKKFGFVDFKGDFFIPLAYDKVVVTSHLKFSKHREKRRKKRTILYVPQRSGKDVRDCEEEFGKPVTLYEIKQTK